MPHCQYAPLCGMPHSQFAPPCDMSHHQFAPLYDTPHSQFAPLCYVHAALSVRYHRTLLSIGYEFRGRKLFCSVSKPNHSTNFSAGPSFRCGCHWTSTYPRITSDWPLCHLLRVTPITSATWYQEGHRITGWGTNIGHAFYI
jgi:hypothetical protein